MTNRLRLALLASILVGCGGQPTPPQPSPEPTESSAAPEANSATEDSTLQPANEVGFAGQSLQPFSVSQICKAGIGVVMGRDPATMESRLDGEAVFLSYIRADDGTEWKYKCRIEGERIMWGADPGRWRDNPADEQLFFAISEGHLEVEERYGDGSSTQKTFA